MTQLYETAYPRLNADPSAQDLEEVYTLTRDEIAVSVQPNHARPGFMARF